MKSVSDSRRGNFSKRYLDYVNELTRKKNNWEENIPLLII